MCTEFYGESFWILSFIIPYFCVRVFYIRDLQRVFWLDTGAFGFGHVSVFVRPSTMLKKLKATEDKENTNRAICISFIRLTGLPVNAVNCGHFSIAKPLPSSLCRSIKLSHLRMRRLAAFGGEDGRTDCVLHALTQFLRAAPMAPESPVRR